MFQGNSANLNLCANELIGYVGDLKYFVYFVLILDYALQLMCFCYCSHGLYLCFWQYVILLWKTLSSVTAVIQLNDYFYTHFVSHCGSR